jgi:HlyD family secretion protein
MIPTDTGPATPSATPLTSPAVPPFTVTITPTPAIPNDAPNAALTDPQATPGATHIALTINLGAAPATPLVAPPAEPMKTAATKPPPVPPVAAAASPTPNPPAAPRPEPTAAPPAISFLTKWKTWLIAAAVIALLVVAGLVAWQMLRPKGPGAGFASGNGRIEATEIDVAAKLAGRVKDVLVTDGDFVTAGQTLAHMQVQTLDAQRDEAVAMRQQSVTAVASAQAQVAARESDRQASLAVAAQRQSELDLAQLRLARSQTLEREGASSTQELDDDRARVRSAQATVVAAKAQTAAAQAAITAARAQVAGTRATVEAADATIARIKADIDDSALTAPRDGRVQYRVAQPGEVLAAGGKVLNLVDLADVYMTFFMPETTVGRLALGSEVHIVLDAAPQFVIPAKVSFVASTAQFTPKTVETATERQKLMFRVKAQVDPALLQKNLKQIKTGLPGVAWIKLDAQAAWPAELAVKVPR